MNKECQGDIDYYATKCGGFKYANSNYYINAGEVP